MKLPEEKRHIFKEPLGRLFRKTEEAFDYLRSLDYEDIITVGDVVSAKFLKNGFEPDMMIVDFATERSPAGDEDIEEIKKYAVPKVEVRNPAGYITDELWNQIENADKPVKIVVDGEEDLATLPASLTASIGSVVVYGQPQEGMVLIEVTEEKKEEFQEYLHLMEE